LLLTAHPGGAGRARRRGPGRRGQQGPAGGQGPVLLLRPKGAAV